jgi:hypothetical protein
MTRRIIGKIRRPGGRRATRGDSDVHLITASLATGEVTSTALCAADAIYAQAYFAAHELLPARFGAGSSSAESEVDHALATIDDPRAGASALLSAIVSLGHVPTAAALHALQRHGASERAHAGVARVAAIECAGLMCSNRSAEAS